MLTLTTADRKETELVKQEVVKINYKQETD